MGHVRSQQLANGNTALEITYGGLEAPFGGVDTSAPPAYIDPRCFAGANGFLIINNKLVATYLAPASIPSTILGGLAEVSLLGFGTFYNSIYGQLNYILGYFPTPFGVAGTSPTGVSYTFFITAWKPGDPATYWDDILTVSIYDGISTQGVASLSLECIASGATSNTTASGAVCNITATDGYGQATAATVTGGTGYSAGMTGLLMQDADQFGSPIGTITSVGAGGAITGFSLIPSGLRATVGPATLLILSSSATTLKIDGPNGLHTYNITATSVGSDYTRQNVVRSMAAQINSPGFEDTNVAATVSDDGYTLILTSKIPGPDGNTVTVQDTSVSADALLAPAFYFPCKTPTHLKGGELGETFAAPTSFDSLSSTSVGGTVYFANLGPMILKYSGPGEFAVSSMYQGVAVIRKFAGKLIGLRPRPQLGMVLKNKDMMWAWTATGQLDIWASVTVDGFVTGAGFEQIADISDYLSGLVVAGGTCFILRSQGISYATSTGSASLPFPVNHMGLGERGEGAQVTALICQFDQTGVYVGGTNVFQISGSISAIGDKIKKFIFSDLASPTLNPSNVNSSATCQVNIGDEEFTLVGLAIGKQATPSLVTLATYFYNVVNGTWMPTTYVAGPSPWNPADSVEKALTGVFASLNNYSEDNEYNQSLFTFGFQKKVAGSLATPTFWTLQEGVPRASSPDSVSFVSFPVEEALFGREVTIDSLYVALNAKVSEDVYVDFYIMTQKYATLTLTPAVFNNIFANPTELQVFPDASFGAGAFTQRSPEVSFRIRPISDTATAQIRFTKIMIMASFDPNQRPT